MRLDAPHFGMKSKPALVTFAAMIVVGLTDLGFVIFGGVDNTLSAWFAKTTYTPSFPPLFFFVFGLGAVISHLFWGMYPEKQ